MTPKRIEIYVNNLEKDKFIKLLMDIFFRDRSPSIPVCVDLDYSIIFDENNAQTFGERDYDTFRVSEVSTESSRNNWRVLANIRICEYPPNLVIILNGLKGEEDQWEKVISISEEISARIKLLGGEIVSSDPNELMPKNPIRVEEKSKEQKTPGKKEPGKSISQKYDKLLLEFEKMEESTQKKFIQAYGFIEELEDKNFTSFNKKDTKKVKVTDEEIISYLFEKMRYPVEDRTIRRIKGYRDVIIMKRAENL